MLWTLEEVLHRGHLGHMQEERMGERVSVLEVLLLNVLFLKQSAVVGNVSAIYTRTVSR